MVASINGLLFFYKSRFIKVLLIKIRINGKLPDILHVEFTV